VRTKVGRIVFCKDLSINDQSVARIVSSTTKTSQNSIIYEMLKKGKRYASNGQIHLPIPIAIIDGECVTIMDKTLLLYPRFVVGKAVSVRHDPCIGVREFPRYFITAPSSGRSKLWISATDMQDNY
jgi:hypothetical protein